MQQYTTLEEILALIPLSENLVTFIGAIAFLLFLATLFVWILDHPAQSKRRRMFNAIVSGVLILTALGCALYAFQMTKAGETAEHALVSNIQKKYKVETGEAVTTTDVITLKNGSSEDKDSRQVVFNLILENGAAYPNVIVRFDDNGEPFMTMTGDLTEVSLLRTVNQ